MPLPIFETQNLYIEVEESQIPWLKIFTKEAYKELSELPKTLRAELYELQDIIEKALIEFYRPEKINIASFGNYLPHVHIHIMARFKEDSFFPEPMWGTKQRESGDLKGDWEVFLEKLSTKLQAFSL